MIQSLNEQRCIVQEIKTEQIDLLQIMQRVEECHSQKELAQSVGFSVGKVNYVIKALLEKGFIKAENFVKSKNKRAYQYMLTKEGIKEKIAITEKYIAIKKNEYEMLQHNLENDLSKIKRGCAL